MLVFPSHREKVIMSDGGHVCLDWYNVKSQDQPTVLFLPGITGTYGVMHADV